MGGSVGPPVSLSVPRQVLGRQEALVFSPDLLHCSLEHLGPNCPCEEQQSLAVAVVVAVVVVVEVEVDIGAGVEVEVEVAAAPSLRHQTPGGASRWPCRSGRGLAAWCLAARPPRALR